jgi:cobalt transporter subunit CbtB
LTFTSKAANDGMFGASHGHNGLKPNREHGADDPIGAKTVTAPATVSGEVEAMPLGAHGQPGRRFYRLSRESGDLPDRKTGRRAHTQLVSTEGDMTTSVRSQSLSVSQRVAAGLVSLFLGATLIFTVGLSHMSFAHNAAHDTRHAIGFPCH